jgi:uncharacterized membrane protein YtjA (UPF0391 family)
VRGFSCRADALSDGQGCDTKSKKYSEGGDYKMLSWALMFLVIAIIAAIFGFGGIAGTAATIAKILFVIFLILFLISLIMGRGRPV